VANNLDRVQQKGKNFWLEVELQDRASTLEGGWNSSKPVFVGSLDRYLQNIPSASLKSIGQNKLRSIVRRT
jgi:hypothetical protein